MSCGVILSLIAVLCLGLFYLLFIHGKSRSEILETFGSISTLLGILGLFGTWLSYMMIRRVTFLIVIFAIVFLGLLVFGIMFGMKRKKQAGHPAAKGSHDNAGTPSAGPSHPGGGGGLEQADLFMGYSSEPQRAVAQKKPDGSMIMASVGSRAWLNTQSPAERRLTTYDEETPPLIEVDSMEGLSGSQEPALAPHNAFIVYQHWGTPNPDGTRLYRGLDAQAAREIARILRSGPTRNLILVVTTFVEGAIRQLADDLDGHPLEMMGFFYVFSGDDLTDNPAITREIAYAAVKLKLRRLSVLTAAFNTSCENSLAEELKGGHTLKVIRVFNKNDAGTYPLIDTPHLQALL